jgi:hypothetical protein
VLTTREIVTWGGLSVAAIGTALSWALQRPSCATDTPIEHSRHIEVAMSQASQTASAAEVAASRFEIDRSDNKVRPGATHAPELGTPDELDAFWEACTPVEPENLEPLILTIESRIKDFERMCASPRVAGKAIPSSQGDWTVEDYLVTYSRVGLLESRYLLSECIAGRLRNSVRRQVPVTVLASSHPISQILLHSPSAEQGAFVARLDQRSDPDLFDQRKKLLAMANHIAANQLAGDEETAPGTSLGH